MKKFVTLSLIITSLLLAGCFAGMINEQRGGTSSSLVNFLYPNGEKPPAVTDEIPVLNLPLRVGLAFVPSTQYDGQIPLAEQIKLLDKVKAAFADEKFIREIVVIPDTYLKGGKGFSTLEQVARLHSVDVMALVSYDQVSNLTDTKASLLYWTIAGAYIVKGNKNDIQTFVDTAVFDMKTQKLLFRAPGISKIESKTTFVDAEDTVRKNKQQGFVAAVDDMNINLATTLAHFKERIKTEKVAIVKHSSSGGGGFIAWYLLLLTACLALCKLRKYCLVKPINMQ